MPITQDTIDKVKAANPGADLEQLSSDSPAFDFLARKPARGVYTIFLQKHEDGQAVEANEMLCTACIVHPDKQALQAVFDDFPSLPHKLANDLRKMAGSDAKITRKKV